MNDLHFFKSIKMLAGICILVGAFVIVPENNSLIHDILWNIILTGFSLYAIVFAWEKRVQRGDKNLSSSICKIAAALVIVTGVILISLNIAGAQKVIEDVLQKVLALTIIGFCVSAFSAKWKGQTAS